jgi:hypothetical protein
MSLDYLKDALMIYPFVGANGQTTGILNHSHIPRGIMHVSGGEISNEQSKWASYGTSLKSASGRYTRFGIITGTAGDADGGLFPLPPLGTSTAFTIRFWVRPYTSVASIGLASLAQSPYLPIRTNASGVVEARVLGTNLVGTEAITVDNWHFIEVNRSGGTARLFVNGVLTASGANAAGLSVAWDFALGGDPHYYGVSSNTYFNDFEFIFGQALNTASYTPPTDSLCARVTGVVRDASNTLAARAVHPFPRGESTLAVNSNGTTGEYGIWLPRYEHDLVCLDTGSLNDRVNRVLPTTPP